MEPNPNALTGLVRYFITLPEPIAMPDDYVWHKTFDHDPAKGEIRQFVNLAFLQSTGTSRQLGSLTATLDSINRVNGKPAGPVEHDAENLAGQYTTVVATTLNDQIQGPGSQWVSPQDIPTRHDPLNRCIEEIAKFIRTYRAALEVACAVPTYEKIGPIISYETATFVPLGAGHDVASGFQVTEWSGGGVLMLDHSNYLDYPSGKEITPEHEGVMSYYRNMLDQGNSLFLWRERFVEARNALYRNGQYGTAVTLSNTASEVLLDGVLSLLYWESGKDPIEAAGIFAEGRLARRVKANFAELLGGQWVLDGDGPVANWFHKCYRLRHRVVHGGYSPSRIEAQTAIDATHSLSLYCWDRLAEKRKSFPRAAMMTIAESGLLKRAKWCNFMRDFMRDVAPNEPNWIEASLEWRKEMHDALLAGN
ncbi:hypothetical protein ACWC1D_15165 [Streptomyces sp. NPDC001478]